MSCMSRSHSDLEARAYEVKVLLSEVIGVD